MKLYILDRRPRIDTNIRSEESKERKEKKVTTKSLK